MINEMWIWKINMEYEQQNGICKMVFENTTFKDARWYLPEVGEPLDELRRVVLVEGDVREVDLEDAGVGVARVEEHQLRFPQVHRRQGARVLKS